MKSSALILILCGVGFLVYGLLNFGASGGSYYPDTPSLGGRYIGYSYGIEARLEAAVGTMLAMTVFMAWYNFCRVHHTLRVTPAMQAGLTDHVWTIHELLAA